MYFSHHMVKKCLVEGDSVDGEVCGTKGQIWECHILLNVQECTITFGECKCPYQGTCKHQLALLLMYLHEKGNADAIISSAHPCDGDVGTQQPSVHARADYRAPDNNTKQMGWLQISDLEMSMVVVLRSCFKGNQEEDCEGTVANIKRSKTKGKDTAQVFFDDPFYSDITNNHKFCFPTSDVLKEPLKDFSKKVPKRKSSNLAP
jgi:hypothetical protein